MLDYELSNQGQIIKPQDASSIPSSIKSILWRNWCSFRPILPTGRQTWITGYRKPSCKMQTKWRGEGSTIPQPTARQAVALANCATTPKSTRTMPLLQGLLATPKGFGMLPKGVVRLPKNLQSIFNEQQVNYTTFLTWCKMVSDIGFEPMTFSMSRRRAEPTTPIGNMVDDTGLEPVTFSMWRKHSSLLS